MNSRNMPKYITKEYVANLAVRTFLSEVGRKKWTDSIDEAHWRKILDEHWEHIKNAFDHSCVYCGVREGSVKLRKGVKLEKDHLIPINKEACGLNHPGNMVPSCSACNNRYHNLEWKEKLRRICAENEEERLFRTRMSKILSHPYKYHRIQPSEKENIKKHAEQLYAKVVKEISRTNNQW